MLYLLEAMENIWQRELGFVAALSHLKMAYGWVKLDRKLEKWKY